MKSMMRRGREEEGTQLRSLQSPPRPSSVSSFANAERGGEKPWQQRSTKRKFQQSVCEALPLPRSSSSFINGVRASSKPSISRRVAKSLSAPLKVYSDGDGNGDGDGDGCLHNQNTTPISLSRDAVEEDMASIECKKKPSVVMASSFKERRRACCSKNQSLKECTNIEQKPVKGSYKAAQGHHHKVISSETCDVLALKEALRIEKESVRLLREELDHERNASASAADEAMAMIARLQEEKAAILMEARQFKRLADERELHNQEAISLLKEMVLHKEEEILALEHELETSRRMFFALEGGRFSGEDSNCPRLLKAEAESVGYGTCVSRFNNGLSGLLSGKENTSSGHAWKSSRRNFSGLISDDIRSNLANCFNKAEEPKAGDVVSKQLAIEWGMEMVSDRRSNDGTTMYTALKSSPMASSGYGEDERGSARMECDEPNLGHDTDVDQSHPLQEVDGKGMESSVWDRIMRLQHRLETFSTDGGQHKHPKEVMNSTTKEEAPEAANYDTDFINEQLSTEDEHDDETGRPSKLQCREGYSISRSLRDSSSEAGTVDRILGSNQVKGFITPEAKDEGNIEAEHVLDVYEIGHVGSQGCEKHCDGSDNKKMRFQSTSVENPDLGPELTAPDLELMEVQSLGSQFTPETFMAKATNSTAGLSTSEIQQLTLRIQALETERQCMNEAISTLRKENEDLKVLQSIAQELHQLRKTTDSSCEETQSDQSVYSLFKGFLSYLRCKSDSGERNLPLGSLNPGFEPFHVKQAGLSFLLQKSPHLKSETVMLRGLKARILPNI